jgi:hypothetical protein
MATVVAVATTVVIESVVTHSRAVAGASICCCCRGCCCCRESTVVGGHMDKLVHAGVEALALGTPVHGLILLFIVVRSGPHAVVLQHQTLYLRVVLKREKMEIKIRLHT